MLPRGVEMGTKKTLRQKSKKRSHSSGLHVVALFEGAKGLLVLLAGFGLLSFIHKDVHEAAARRGAGRRQPREKENSNNEFECVVHLT